MTYFLDTCSLKWRYLNGSPTTAINQLVDNSANKVIISELTVLEWSSALAARCRENKMLYETFKKSELDFMTDIANERLIVFPLIRSVEKARYLIDYVGAEKKRPLNTGDSIQLVTALEVANTVRKVVTFVTCDEKLAKIIHDIDTFQPYLHALFLRP